MNIQRSIFIHALFIVATVCVQLNAQNQETIEKRTISTTIGKEFTVRVYENGTTGFLWFWLTNAAPDKNPIQLLRKETIVKENRPFLVGAGQDVNWIFKATQSGKYFITLVYKRPWEQSIGQYLEIEVTVKDINTKS